MKESLIQPLNWDSGVTGVFILCIDYKKRAELINRYKADFFFTKTHIDVAGYFVPTTKKTLTTGLIILANTEC